MTTRKSMPSPKDIARLICIHSTMQAQGIFQNVRPKASAQTNHVIDLAGPDYSEAFNRFRMEICTPFWTDKSYSRHACAKRLRSQKMVEKCTLADLRKLLTYCWRSDRFCTGFLEAKVTDGSICRLVARLSKISQVN